MAKKKSSSADYTALPSQDDRYFRSTGRDISREVGDGILATPGRAYHAVATISDSALHTLSAAGASIGQSISSFTDRFRGTPHDMGSKGRDKQGQPAFDCSGWVTRVSIDSLRANGIHDRKMEATLTNSSVAIARGVGERNGFFSQEAVRAGQVPAGTIIAYTRPGNISHIAIVAEKGGKKYISECNKDGVQLVDYKRWLQTRGGLHLIAAPIFKDDAAPHLMAKNKVDSKAAPVPAKPAPKKVAVEVEAKPSTAPVKAAETKTRPKAEKPRHVSQAVPAAAAAAAAAPAPQKTPSRAAAAAAPQAIARPALPARQPETARPAEEKTAPEMKAVATPGDDFGKQMHYFLTGRDRPEKWNKEAKENFQRALIEKTGMPIKVDGKPGKETLKAARLWQKNARQKTGPAQGPAPLQMGTPGQ